MSTTDRHTRWLRRLMAAFPTPAWEPEKVTSYLDALHGAEDRHIDAALDRVLRGGWKSDFAPIGPTLRLLVDEIAREEADDRRRKADAAKRREHEVAGPWHAHLWSAWFHLEHRLPIPTELQPYADIIERHQVTPETAGCRQAGPPDHTMFTDPDGITTGFLAALDDAEQVWRQSGSTETAQQAARRALGGMTGRRAA